MKLYCWQHNAAHDFQPDDVELIVYALTGAYTDEMTTEDGDRPYAGEDPGFVMPCPRDVLAWAGDPEMYAEHVEQGVECRKAISEAR